MIWLVFINFLIVSVSIFSRDMTIPSLPAIASSLHSSDVLAQASLTICLAGIGLSQLFYGPLSDVFGRKNILLIGFSICLIGNIISGVVDSIILFLITRFLAGIGAGAGTVIARAIARDLFDKSQLTKVLSYLSMSTTISPAIAPLIGGYLQSYFGWQSVFIVLSIVTFFSIWLIFFFIKESTQNTANAHSIHWKGVLNNYSALIKNPWFLGHSLISAFAFASGIIYYLVSPFLFQKDLGLSPDQNGWIYILVAICYFLGAFITSRITKTISDEKTIVLGLYCCTISAIFLILLALNYNSLLMIVIPVSYNIIGCGIITPIANKQALHPFPEIAGTASSLLSAIRMIFTFTVGLIITAVGINSSFYMGVFLFILSTLGLLIYRKFHLDMEVKPVKQSIT